MDQAFLVDMQRNAAARAAAEIQRSSPDVDVIVAAKFAEYSSPRLVLASSAFAGHSLIFDYMKFGELLQKIGEEEDEPPSLLLMSTDDPFVTELRRSVGPVNKAKGLHLSGQSLGGRFVEDAYVYRVQ
jgi:hypothetical protein